ncbi:MAG: HNH endonuclease [Salinibacterium sp.]|nr:MAG: HNH endonuclease [Salinibacterium sp.]
MAEFILKPDNRNASEAAVIQDIQDVAGRLGRTPTLREYSSNGRYSASVIRRIFGTWNAALGKAGFAPNVEARVDIDRASEDVLRIAKELGHPPTHREYDEHGVYSSKPLRNHFGSWNKTLMALGLSVRFESNISTERLIENLEEVWVRLGRQPSWADMSGPASKFAARTYAHRFGTWRGALEAFVDFMNADESPVNETRAQSDEVADPKLIELHQGVAPGRTARNVNLRTRFLVMRRDHFSCVICGRSPAKDPTVELQIDHIIAWSKGGDGTMDNLQTLCTDCNLGKSDLDFL